MPVDKKTIHKGLFVNSEENEIILAVQKYHGMQEFSALVIWLFREEYKELNLGKEKD